MFLFYPHSIKIGNVPNFVKLKYKFAKNVICNA